MHELLHLYQDLITKRAAKQTIWPIDSGLLLTYRVNAGGSRRSELSDRSPHTRFGDAAGLK